MNNRHVFACTLRVTLVDGSKVVIARDIKVDHTDPGIARSYVDEFAREICDDAGSRWFDAPVDDVEVVRATYLGDGAR